MCVIYHLQDSAGQMAWINLYLSNSSQEGTGNKLKRNSTGYASTCTRVSQDHLSDPSRGSGSLCP